MGQKSSKQQKQQNNPALMQRRDWAVLGAGLVVVAGLLTFVGIRLNRPVADVPPATATTSVVQPETSDHDHAADAAVQRMTVAELRAAIHRGEAVAMDVRDADGYTGGHIPGSLHIPLNSIESQVPYLPRDKTIVAYCT